MSAAPLPGVSRRRLLAPEVVQTSEMDCGPAALTCLLEGHGVSASYGRLREACQTTVDGTSIDTLEDVARALGLDAEQVMIPLDHVLLAEARALPALAVVRLPNGFTHFVVVWSRHGPWVQVMDPGSGRRWTRVRELEREIYVHEHVVPAEAYRDWVGSEAFRAPLLRRLRAIGVEAAEAAVAEAAADPGPGGFAVLDAATRMVAALVAAGAVGRGAEAARMVEALRSAARDGAPGVHETIPASYWSAQPLPATGEVRLRGAVLLSVKGLLAGAPSARSAELEAALAEAPRRPLAELGALLGQGGWRSPVLLVLAAVLVAVAGIVEALLLRAFLDLSTSLGLPGQRWVAVGLAALAMLLFLAMELAFATETRRIGRGLEIRLRRAFLAKLPRLPDRYLQSRPTSDMASRAHAIHHVRGLPEAAARFLHALLTVAAAAAAICWIDPASAPLAVAGAIFALAVPVAAVAPLTERDMRTRVHAGALSRFYLDAMLGQVPILSHGAERSVRREHETLLAEWMRSARSLVDVGTVLELVRGVVMLGIALQIVRGFVVRGGDAGGVLLLAWWSLSLVAGSHEILRHLRQYPVSRNLVLRLLEPLGALEDGGGADAAASSGEAGPSVPLPGVAIEVEGASVVAGGHPILESVTLRLPPGGHVAVVGPSGAGKSSLMGLFLGFHAAARGRVRVDGVELRGGALDALRHQTAWVDPAVQLWNRSLADNLLFGHDGAGGHESPIGALPDAIRKADLVEVLESLPDGLQLRLGEGGALLSGGEGQRVRFGRALLRSRARLVLLDEPFRGLELERRRELLHRARSHWDEATLLCVSHDVADTLSFPRVLVVEGGRIVEDGDPAELSSRPGSRYRALLDAERGTWGSAAWRNCSLRGGRIDEEGAP